MRRLFGKQAPCFYFSLHENNSELCRAAWLAWCESLDWWGEGFYEGVLIKGFVPPMLVGLEVLDSQSQQGVWTLKGKNGNMIGLFLTPVYLFMYLNCHKRLIYMYFKLIRSLRVGFMLSTLWKHHLCFRFRWLDP